MLEVINFSSRQRQILDQSLFYYLNNVKHHIGALSNARPFWALRIMSTYHLTQPCFLKIEKDLLPVVGKESTEVIYKAMPFPNEGSAFGESLCIHIEKHFRGEHIPGHV
jgi:hypothetical protein